MKRHQTEAERQNMARTGTAIDGGLTQRRSGPVRCELVGHDGQIYGPFSSRAEAVKEAQRLWPDREQGDGWDIQTAGLRDPQPTD